MAIQPLVHNHHIYNLEITKKILLFFFINEMKNLFKFKTFASVFVTNSH